jgi:hypothetical protein
MAFVRIQLNDTGIQRRDLIDVQMPLPIRVENVIQAIVDANVQAGRDFYKRVTWRVSGFVEAPKHTAFIVGYRLPPEFQNNDVYHLVVGVAYIVRRG